MRRSALTVTNNSDMITFTRTSTGEKFDVLNGEVFGLILDISEVTDYDRMILHAHRICLEKGVELSRLRGED